MAFFVLTKQEGMSSYDIFWGIGDFSQSLLGLMYDNVGNMANYSFIVLGFVGLFIWLNMQNKYNKAAEADPSKLK
ncbi:MAG: hypothetical protein ACI865_002281 [Flavobacteriaceae bacterium]|jgi:hypothetical protein